MNLLNEFPAPLGLPLGVKPSCLIQDKNSYIGFDPCRHKAYSLNCDGFMEQFELQHGLEKLTLLPEKNMYIAVSRYCPNHLYFLNDDFREIDLLKIYFPEPIMEDIYFDNNSNLIWLLTSSKVYRANINGDSLGSFLSSPRDTEYQAVATYGNFLFIAYTKGGGSYLSAYTKQGSFLEKISLGCEYSISNLQVLIDDDDNLCLFIYAIKSYCFPYVLKVELDKKKDTCGLSVECVSEINDICSTCNISTSGNK